MQNKADLWLTRVRKTALALPEVTERPSHGSPSWFIKKSRSFLSFLNNHHGDGKLALWCAATMDAQQLLINAEPEHFFVPAYVGHLGWVGMRLDRGIAVKKVNAIIEQAWRVRAPPSLVR